MLAGFVHTKYEIVTEKEIKAEDYTRVRYLWKSVPGFINRYIEELDYFPCIKTP